MYTLCYGYIVLVRVCLYAVERARTLVVSEKGISCLLRHPLRSLQQRTNVWVSEAFEYERDGTVNPMGLGPTRAHSISRYSARVCELSVLSPTSTTISIFYATLTCNICRLALATRSLSRHSVLEGYNTYAERLAFISLLFPSPSRNLRVLYRNGNHFNFVVFALGSSYVCDWRLPLASTTYAYCVLFRLYLCVALLVSRIFFSDRAGRTLFCLCSLLSRR